ncbi:IS1634 family transposase [Endozoicomonas montiporae CL-33]|uniref:IS1634 family transposase n=1 Tax=Endozoicomonas montiporae CL-33 TaxID=570277 RepID=A0A142B930_9GAMM|nr:IS1634 family transposase [Endozoicomonas montiporae CL-33]
MVVTLCLMAYAAIQHRICYELKKKSRTFPNMKKKLAQNPTGRCVFLCFEGIYLLTPVNTKRHVICVSESQETILFIYWSQHTNQFIPDWGVE